jgi:membrane associated rhomboid family serine protease
MQRPIRSGFGGGFPSIPRVTLVLLVLLVGGSLLAAVVTQWIGLGNAYEWLALVPAEVLRGQVWRLATYPWLDTQPFWLLISALILGSFGSQLERQWGSRTFARRTAVFVVVPAVLVTLVALFSTRAALTPYLGVHVVIVCYIAAFACEFRGAQVRLMFLPWAFSGDQLLMLEAAFIGLGVILGGSVIAYLPIIFGFLFVLAWFRFDLGRDLRRTWLQMRKARLERSMEKLRRQRNLRVVRDDEEGQGGRDRFLH